MGKSWLYRFPLLFANLKLGSDICLFNSPCRLYIVIPWFCGLFFVDIGICIAPIFETSCERRRCCLFLRSVMEKGCFIDWCLLDKAVPVASKASFSFDSRTMEFISLRFKLGSASPSWAELTTKNSPGFGITTSFYLPFTRRLIKFVPKIGDSNKN